MWSSIKSFFSKTYDYLADKWDAATQSVKEAFEPVFEILDTLTQIVLSFVPEPIKRGCQIVWTTTKEVAGNIKEYLLSKGTWGATVVVLGVIGGGIFAIAALTRHYLQLAVLRHWQWQEAWR